MIEIVTKAEDPYVTIIGLAEGIELIVPHSFIEPYNIIKLYRQYYT